MGSYIADIGAIFAALAAGDSWEISNALGQPGSWGFGLLVMILGSVLILLLFKAAPVLDRHLERTLMVVVYLAIAGIIFVEVIRRFVLSQQEPWSTTLPPYLFLLLTWFGCAFNVKLRAHLSFTEFRNRMPRSIQLICLFLDNILWLGMAWIVITTTLRLTANSASNFQMLLGTDHVMIWWFVILVPVAFTILAARALENMIEDMRRFREGAQLIAMPKMGDS
ncbi:TRAP transporter small permease [Paracoccus seriniphilus]|uniref:TRAP transporter small permease n=1 Tax=Paracoccus seriniphilus TaxID=184748 RepID=UPI0035632814